MENHIIVSEVDCVEGETGLALVEVLVEVVMVEVVISVGAVWFIAVLSGVLVEVVVDGGG